MDFTPRRPVPEDRKLASKPEPSAVPPKKEDVPASEPEQSPANTTIPQETAAPIAAPAASDQAPAEQPADQTAATGLYNAPASAQPGQPAGMSRRQKVMLLVAAIIVVLGVAAGTVYFSRGHGNTPKNSAATGTSQSAASTHETTVQTTPPNATDNASLEQDLNSINSSLSTANASQNAAGSALNDRASQIDVPTN